MAPKSKVDSLPHSWPVADWPATVYPNRSNAARWLVRSHKDDLMACGALTRINRELVILGEGYARFLARKIERVESFDATRAANAANAEKKAANAAKAERLAA
jgi:hypothetical protein